MGTFLFIANPAREAGPREIRARACGIEATIIGNVRIFLKARLSNEGGGHGQ
jgi:hypothetical protein